MDRGHETPQLVNLNVGGTKFTTTMSTLRLHGENFFTTMIDNDTQGKVRALRDDKGFFFVDRNGELFKVILDYLRSGAWNIPPSISLERVNTELDFYRIDAATPSDKNVLEKVTQFQQTVSQSGSELAQEARAWLQDNHLLVLGAMKKDLDEEKTTSVFRFRVPLAKPLSGNTPDWMFDRSLRVPGKHGLLFFKILASLITKEWSFPAKAERSVHPQSIEITLIVDWGMTVDFV